MATFDIGETVICSIEIMDEAGALKDPATSMTITIRDRHDVVKVDNVAMTKDAIGKYHYDFQTANYERGEYTCKYTATDGSRITIEEESLTLV